MVTLPLTFDVRRIAGPFLAAVVALALSFASPARAEDPKTPSVAVPDALKPWVPWVLDGTTRCPWFNEHADQSRCAWPSRLELTLGDKGGTFAESWHVDAPTSVPLPGDAKRWPLDATVDGKLGIVIANGGEPRVELAVGDHVVRGTFAWDSLPESLAVPKETGLVTLTLRGARIASPSRDAGGTVWLQKAVAHEEGDALGIVVYRKVSDDIPMRVVTRIELHVSGKSREELLGKAVLPGFVPMSLDSPIPARVEADGRVRVQVRPGVFVLELTARSRGPIHALTRPPPDGPWKEGDEVWVFEAKNDYRVVSVRGVSSIDPQQTTLPDAWKRLPAYPMAVGATMTFDETRRGDADPPPDQLTLARTLWLDFDGKGYTALDSITGTLTRESRLTMAPPTVLGRVAMAGRDQFITTLPASDGHSAETGVEVRQGELSVSADSRIPGPDVADIPAVGWAHDFHQVTGTLHLPPGWTLLFATGVDDVPGTWVRHWSLLQIFLALVIGIVLGRLYGAGWGALSLVMLALTLPEVDAPEWCWVPLLAFEALVRIVPAGRARKLFEGARLAAFVVVVIVTVPFVVAEVRQGLHPDLRDPGVVVGSGEAAREEATGGGFGAKGTIAAPASAPPAEASAVTQGLEAYDVRGRAGGSLGAMQRQAGDRKAKDWQSTTEVYDPSAIVQTGPGLPRWSWTTIELRWSGPVAAAQRLRLYLVSPGENLALSLLRSALLLLVVLRLLPYRARAFPRLFGAAAALLAFVALCPAPARADVPDKATLDELKARLLRPSPCSPSCASSGRMSVDVTERSLRLRIEVDAAAATAVPLPGTGAQWTPSDVRVDGKATPSLARVDDVLWVALDAGVHQVTMEGPAPERASVQLSLPLKPHHVEATASGWTVAGIHEDGLADDDIQLTRVETGASKSHDAVLEPGALPPFVTVTRTLHVGLDWEMDTEVTRMTPVGTAVVLSIPLLSGESVTTADVRVADGRVAVFLAPDATTFAWHSRLVERSPVRLAAAKDVGDAGWVEVWRIDVGSIWHATYEGIPFVHAAGRGGAKIPEWRPWPGEEARVILTRPEGVPGQTLTIDESATAIRPGLRATDVTLSLTLRSSRGGDHTFTLPDGSQLESVSINGAVQPIRQDDRKVTLPIVPGAQKIDLAFRVARGLGTVFTSPGIDLGAPSVNATVTVEVPGSRWLLFTSGPGVGPAVLFWSLLVVLLALAALLGQNRWTPLMPWQWALLFVGLSQVDVVGGAVFVGWLLALGWRARHDGENLAPGWFNLRQIVLIAWTLAALFILGASLHQGLLGAPDMQVMGNGSSSALLRWFADRVAPALPSVRIVSVPLLVYRGAMLSWALWIVLSLLAWLRWGWGSFTRGGTFRKGRPRRPSPPPPPVAEVRTEVAPEPSPAPVSTPEGAPSPGTDATLAYPGVTPQAPPAAGKRLVVPPQEDGTLAYPGTADDDPPKGS